MFSRSDFTSPMRCWGTGLAWDNLTFQICSWVENWDKYTFVLRFFNFSSSSRKDYDKAAMTQKVFIIFNTAISEVSSVLWMHCSFFFKNKLVTVFLNVYIVMSKLTFCKWNRYPFLNFCRVPGILCWMFALGPYGSCQVDTLLYKWPWNLGLSEPSKSSHSC